MTHVDDIAGHAGEFPAVVDHARQRSTSQVDPMIAPGARDKLGPLRFALGPMVGEADLDGGIHGLGPRRSEEDTVETVRQHATQLFRKLEGDRCGALEMRREIQFLQLRIDRIGNFLTAMPGCAGEETGRAVQDLLTVRRPVAHPLGFLEHLRFLMEQPVVGEREPVVVHIDWHLRHRPVIPGLWNFVLPRITDRPLYRRASRQIHKGQTPN